MKPLWKCSICQFEADTDEAKQMHHQFPGHTEAQVLAASKALQEAIFGAVEQHYPEDINRDAVLSRSIAIKTGLGLSRTSGLGAIVAGSIMTAMTGVPRETVITIVTNILDVMLNDQSVQEFIEKYSKINAEILAIKAEASSIEQVPEKEPQGTPVKIMGKMPNWKM